MTEEQKVALVTGATRGIGAAIADRLNADGIKVIGTATTAEGATAITAKGHAGIQLQLDDPDSIQDILKNAFAEHGQPLICVNNAGVTLDALLLRIKPDDWDRVMQINLGSVFRICKLALPGMMKARWGRIINIGSVVGSMGNAGQSAYAASKAGLSGFGRSIAKEVASRNCTINTIEPGFIETDMTAGLSEEIRAATLTMVPMQRLGTPTEVAGLVAYLASPEAGYITGETIGINGGMFSR